MTITEIDLTHLNSVSALRDQIFNTLPANGRNTIESDTTSLIVKIHPEVHSTNMYSPLMLLALYENVKTVKFHNLQTTKYMQKIFVCDKLQHITLINDGCSEGDSLFVYLEDYSYEYGNGSQQKITKEQLFKNYFPNCNTLELWNYAVPLDILYSLLTKTNIVKIDLHDCILQNFGLYDSSQRDNTWTLAADSLVFSSAAQVEQVYLQSQ